VYPVVYLDALRGACPVWRIHRREDQGNYPTDPESAVCRDESTGSTVACQVGSTVAYQVGSRAAYPVLSRAASKGECLAEMKGVNSDETKAAS